MVWFSEVLVLCCYILVLLDFEFLVSYLILVSFGFFSSKVVSIFILLLVIVVAFSVSFRLSDVGFLYFSVFRRIENRVVKVLKGLAVRKFFRSKNFVRRRLKS